MRTYGLSLFCIIVLAFMMPSSVIADESPASIVRAEVASVLAIVQDRSLDTETRRSKLRRIIRKRFDFRDISQRVLAVNWERATLQQRDQFVSLFTRLLENTYFRVIESYNSETVNVGGERVQGDTATVIVTIVREDGTDIPLLLKLKRIGANWIAYDANIEGVSLVSNYRTSFGEVVSKHGIIGLLEDLKQRLASKTTQA